MRYPLLLVLWLVSDLVLFVASYAFAYFLRVGWILSTDFPFDSFMTIVVMIAPLWLVVLASLRTFALLRSQATLRNGLVIAYASIVGVAFFTIGYYFQYTAFFSRLLLVEAAALSFGAIWVWHVLYEQMERRILRRRPCSFPTLIVGVTRESRRLIERLNRTHSPLKPVAILDGRGVTEKEIDSVPVLGKLNLLEDVLQSQRITHVIQTSDLEQSLNLLSACRKRGITYMLLPSVLGIVERDERVDSIEGQPAIVVNQRSVFSKFFDSPTNDKF